MCVQGRERRLNQRGQRASPARWGSEAGLWGWPQAERLVKLAHLDSHLWQWDWPVVAIPEGGMSLPFMENDPVLEELGLGDILNEGWVVWLG